MAGDGGHRARDRTPERARVELIVAWGLWTHPLVLPAALVWCAVSLVAWRRLGARRERAGDPAPTVWPLLFACAVGCLVAVTLTPSRIGLGLDLNTHQPVWCHPQWPRTGFGLWSPNGERRLNVVLGVPLGLAALGWYRARPRAAATALAPVTAVALPEAIEFAQATIPALGRVCAVVDAVDNVSGVLLGFGLALVGAAVHAVVRSRPRRA
jgi:hypothetical protein